jgi:hypothetical protein
VTEAPPSPASGSLGLRSQPPARTESGERLRPAPEVELLDASGQSVKLDGVIVRAAIGSGSGDLEGDTSRPTDGDGRVKFEDLSINGEEEATVTLAFTASGFARVDSQPILIEDD